MKKNYFLIVICIVLTMFHANSLECKAYDNEMSLSTNFTAHWMSYLPDETKICDLSIACAHDAATHAVRNDTHLYQDQKWNEWSLFQMGVRAFDLRLSDENCYRHGSNDSFKKYLNSYEEEQKNNMPTPDNLKGEFMVLFIQWEGDGASDETIKNGFQVWLDKVMGDSENPYTKDMFVRYHKGLTLGDVRGKILVISNEGRVLSEAAIKNEAHRIPIAWHNGDYICDSKEGYPDDKVITSVMDPYLRQGDYELNTEDKKKDVSKCFDNWFDIYKKDNYNQSGRIHVNMLNSYYLGIYVNLNPGIEICRDDLWGTGVNHTAYDYLNDKHDPYGFVWCDFLGYDWGYWSVHYYGNKLLERIVMNNFYSLGTEGKYISDLVICSKNFILSSDNVEQWKEEGWIFLDEATTIDKPFTFGIVGYKTTNDINKAITNVLIYKSTDTTPPDTITGPCNHKYIMPITYDLDKSYLNYEDGNYMYLYYTKESGTDSIAGQAITTMEYVKTASDSCAYMWNPNDKSYTAAAKLRLSPVLPSKYDRYLKLTTHKHNYSLNFDSLSHYNECVLCGIKTNNDKHNTQVKQSVSFHHIDACTVCGYNRPEICKAKGYDHDGFGICDSCHNICAQAPGLNISKLYSIVNPGNLYWVAAHANTDDYNYSCDQYSDIAITDEIQAKVPWVPIGTSEKAAKKYLKENGELKIADEKGERFGNGYHGTFDGRGHTISINYDGGTKYPACGVFGYLNHATVKNLGIVNSSFTGYDYVGSLAGKIDSATIQNVYSTASITNTSNSTYQGGIAGYISGNTTISNGYYYGTAERSFGEIVGKKTKVKNFFTNNKDDANATYATDEQFSSGELCYTLNGSKYGHDVSWHQNLGDYYKAELLPCVAYSHDIVVPAKYNDRKFVGLGHTDNYGAETENYKISTLVLKDGYDFSIPVKTECYVDNCSTKLYAGGHWGTVCLPYRISSDNSYTLYTINDAEQDDQSGTIKLTPVENYLEAYTPAVFYKKADVDSLNFRGVVGIYNYQNIYTFYKIAVINPQKDNSCITADSSNTYTHLNGTFEEREIASDGSIWSLYLDNDKLWPLDGANTATVKPFRAWITYNQQSSDSKIPEALVINSDVTTSVSKDDLVIDANEFDFDMFDMSGRRVVVPYRGQIIIRNGKKLVRK